MYVCSGEAQDLGGGKNCVPAMKVLSGAGYSEGSKNAWPPSAAVVPPLALVVAADVAVAAAPDDRRLCCVWTPALPLPPPDELSPAVMYWLSGPSS